MRTVFGQDVATGTISLEDTPDYKSQGPAYVFDVKSEVPSQPDVNCYVLRAPLTGSVSIRRFSILEFWFTIPC